jgi:hypothetical protein
MREIEGTWFLQVYRPDPGSSFTADLIPGPSPVFPIPPRFVSWMNVGIVKIDRGGTTGTLEVFLGTSTKHSLHFRVADGSPATLSASAAMTLPSGKKLTHELQGWFVPKRLGQEVGKDNPLVVRGSIVQTSAGIAEADEQPMFTTGLFVLQPLL